MRDKATLFQRLRFGLAGSGCSIQIKLLAAGIILLALAIILRIPSLEQPVNRDISAYATIGAELQHGKLPYRDIFDHKQPFVYIVYWVISLIAPRSNSAIQIAAALVAGLASILLFYFLIGRISILRSFLAALLFTFLAVSNVFEGIDLNTEHLLVPISCAAFFFPIHFSARSTSKWVPFIAGLLGGWAVLTKLVAILPLPGILVFLILTRRRVVSTVFWYGAGAAIPVLGLILIYLLAGAASDLFYANIFYNLVYIAQGSQSVSGFVERFFRSLLMEEPFYSSLVGLALTAASIQLVAKRGRAPITWTILFWLMGAVIGAALSARGFPHYYIPILAPAVTLIALSFDMRGALFWKLAPAGILVILSVPLLTGVVRTFQLDPNEIATQMYGKEAEAWLEQERVGKWLKEHGDENDTLLVTGAEPGFYWSSGFRPATRFIYDYPLFLDASLLTKFRRDLEIQPPEWIVIPVERVHPVVFEVLNQDSLKEEAIFGSVHIYSYAK